MVPRMLLDMQNRGQLAAGMTSYSPVRSSILATHKDLGTVAEAFRMNAKPEFEALMSHLGGPAAIGHVRYATWSRVKDLLSRLDPAQPRAHLQANAVASLFARKLLQTPKDAQDAFEAFARTDQLLRPA